VNDIIAPSGERVLNWNQINIVTGHKIAKGKTPIVFNIVKEVALDICHFNRMEQEYQQTADHGNLDISSARQATENTLANIPQMLPRLKSITTKGNK